MYLGIDLGTSSVKLVLINEKQSLIAEATQSMKVSRPHPGWSEQDPQEWVRATEAGLKEISKTAPTALAATFVIGLSGQMHGATCVGADGRSLRPSILWNDTRAVTEATMLDRMPEFQRISGNIVFPGFTAPKIAWLKEHEPQNFDNIYKVLLPKDYLRLWLTGEYVSDMSDASGTSWLDVQRREWSRPLLSASNLQLSQMPNLVEGSATSGTLRPALAERFGFKRKVLVAGGAGDNAAAAIGLGVIDNNQAFVSLGTSGVLFAANEHYRPSPETALHCFCHALPKRWHQMSVILACTDALNWFASLVGKDAATLVNALGPKPDNVPTSLFLPYLGGERTPHNDATIRACLLGLGHEHDLNAVVKSVIQGVCLAFRDCMTGLEKTGTRPTSLLVAGGGSQSDYWLSLLASTLRCSVVKPKTSALGGAIGAARLAMLMDGHSYHDCLTKPETMMVFHQDPQLADKIDKQYERYRSAYKHLKEI